ncbi:MAG: peptidylprolyl isomerase [bacterium]|nr:peptidylprolyl isomerase [bacterium]
MKKLLICATISTVLLSGCSFNGSRDTVINVNGNAITKGQFEKALDKELDNSMFKAFGGSKNFLKSDDNVMYLMYKEKTSRELIVKSLLDAEIAKRGIKVSDDDMKAEMKTIVDKVGSKEELAKLIKQRGISNAEFNEDLATQIKMKKLINSISKVKISDAETLNYYKKNPDKFKNDEQVRASHILISSDILEMTRTIRNKNKNITPEDMTKELEKMEAERLAKAEEILKQVKANPNDFEKIAQKVSDDKASGERGGELGFFPRKAMVKEFSDAAFSMKPNTISDKLVKTPYGYHIIKVTDRMEAGTTPYDKIKEEIRFYLETEEQLKILKNLTEGLMKTAQIDYVDKSFDPAEITKQAGKAQKETNEKLKAAEKE